MRWKIFQTDRDEVDILLSDLQRQGAGRARLAHFFATLLVVLFSAGSLVALGSDALNSVVTQWERDRTLDIPSAISLCVTFLVVICCDIAMIHAAGMLRVLAARRAETSERQLHAAVMFIGCVLESGTYLYMSWQYEHPVTLAAQALIAARAIAAPLLAVYLSMARPLPATARDMLAFAELSSGSGVLRDIVSAANNRTIDLPAFAAKMKLYAASSIMVPEDRARLQGMISAVVNSAGSESPYTHVQEGSQSAGSGTGEI
jgi:hypothetical protein